MADVITRFRLETTQYDSKLRDAAKGLKEVVRVAELGGKDFKNFSDKAIENARALGQTASGATNAKDRLKDLVGSFNEAAKAYNNLSQTQQQSDFGKALSQSLEQLQQRIKQTKDELYSLGDASKGGGLFGESGMMKGMLQVAGGNLMTMAGSWLAGLAGDVKEAIVQSAELARQAEGVQLAFNRLGRGDLLDGLRQATHNTVSDLELMKAAVKFDDFKLPVEELGTMLAFAQKKAKDTGQSIDYMVDSIVTGLGRKSLMILDNLGLSAAEIRDKMKETGDMTKAVGEIIREQMQKSGDYVETAADRVAKANVELNNQMLELGNTMQDVLGFSGWDELATKIKTEVVGAIQFTIETIGEAKNAWNSFMQTIGVKDKPKKDNRPTRMPDGTYWETTDSQGNVTASGRWLNGKRVQTGLGDVIVTGNKSDKTTPRTRTPKVKTIDASKVAFTGGEGYKWEQPQIEHQSLNDLIGEDNLRAYLGMPKGEMQRDWGKELGKVFAEYVADPDKKKRDGDKNGDKTSQEQLQGIQTMVGSLQSIVNGIQTLGIELPEELSNILGVLQTITGIVGSIQAMQEIGTFLGLFHNGGIVPHAANGYYVPGNNYSGDVTPVLANAGELILNKAAQASLASQLSGSNNQQPSGSPYITGEMIYLGLNNYLKSTGRGEIMTSRFKQ